MRNPALDGLRGVAVLLVLLAHSSNVGLRLHPALDLSGCGRMGVFLFFVLSAYLLTGQLLATDGLARPVGCRAEPRTPPFSGKGVWEIRYGETEPQLVGYLDVNKELALP